MFPDSISLKRLKQLHADIPTYHENDNHNNGTTISKYSYFYLGLWNLQEDSIRGCLFTYLLLSLNNVEISPRDDYLLKYWAFELDMIKEQKSYRSKLPAAEQRLTSPKTLNTILDRDEKTYPNLEALFRFLENSSKRKKNVLHASESPVPFEHELDKFIPRQENVSCSFFAPTRPPSPKDEKEELVSVPQNRW